MATILAGRELQELRKTLGVSQEEFARIIGVSARTVARWENDVSVPSIAAPSLAAWEKIIEKLNFIEEDIAGWFRYKNKALDGRRPIEVAMEPGGTEKILELVGRIEWGIPT